MARQLPRALFALALTVTACGTVGTRGGDEDNLPNNRTGPFRELSPDETGGTRCTAIDYAGRFDEPSVVRLPDGRVALFGTHERMGRRSIARVILRGLAHAPDEPVDVLIATLPWHGTSVSSPDVTAVPHGGFVMAYATASGTLGLAHSPDGATWSPAPMPVLEPRAADGEETSLRAPSLVALPDGGFALAYVSGSAIWLARAASDGVFVRVDADPSTSRRDPLLGASGAAWPEGDAGVGFESGALDDPSLHVEVTVAGRPLWRLYYTARSVPQAMDGGFAPSVTITMAASFDGLHFVRYGAPVITSRTDPSLSAPSLLALDARRTMLYMSGRCDLAGRTRGIRAAIAPGTERLAPVP